MGNNKNEFEALDAADEAMLAAMRVKQASEAEAKAIEQRGD